MLIAFEKRFTQINHSPERGRTTQSEGERERERQSQIDIRKKEEEGCRAV